jgi:hypothetical protein
MLHALSTCLLCLLVHMGMSHKFVKGSMKIVQVVGAEHHSCAHSVREIFDHAHIASNHAHFCTIKPVPRAWGRQDGSGCGGNAPATCSL